MVDQLELARAVSSLRANSCSQDPNQEPRQIATMMRSIIDEVLSAEHLAVLRAFANGSAPWLHLKSVHPIANPPGQTPATMEPGSEDRRWWPAGYVVLGVLEAMGLSPMSFECENGGKLFVNLVPQAGAGRQAAYSKGVMDGHTDALPFPFPGEYRAGLTPPPAPDFLVLVGLRNPANTPTFVSAMSAMLRDLVSSVIAQLRLPKFILGKQPSFDCQYIGKDKSVIGMHPVFGSSIRFSQSRVAAAEDDIEANGALERLGTQMIKVRERLCVEPGDILLINNRLALHGRDAVPIIDGVEARWLLRTYAYHPATVEALDGVSTIGMKCL